MQTEPPAVRAEMSLAEDVLSLGEPIVLRYTFIGTQTEGVSLYMGRDKKDWITVALTDAEGNLAPPVPDPRMRQGGIHGVGIGASAGEHPIEYAVVNRLVRPTHPGDYRLSARVRMPYTMRSQMEGVSPSQWGEASGTVLTREDTFPLTLTELDPARLRVVAERLAEEAVQEDAPARGKFALQALFAMPGEYVLPVWRAVTTSEDPRLLDQWGVISDELARVQTAHTADLLAEMHWNPPQAVRDRLNIKSRGFLNLNLMAMNNIALKYNNMYFTADPPLKQHIEELCHAHGTRVPESRMMI